MVLFSKCSWYFVIYCRSRNVRKLRNHGLIARRINFNNDNDRESLDRLDTDISHFWVTRSPWFVLKLSSWLDIATIPGGVQLFLRDARVWPIHVLATLHCMQSDVFSIKYVKYHESLLSVDIFQRSCTKWIYKSVHTHMPTAYCIPIGKTKCIKVTIKSFSSLKRA